MDRLSSTLNALADPTRRAILKRLVQGEAAVSELAEPFDLSVRAISKHVAVLERAGLVARERQAQRNLSRLTLEPLQELEEWLSDYRDIWEARHDNVARLLTAMQEKDVG